MSELSWRDDIASRFAARANPELRRATSPSLAALADQSLADPTGDDVDLPDLIRFAVAFQDSRELSDTDRRRRALRSGGGAFLHATSRPTDADVTLIVKGNSQKHALDITSKLARDTWAYMVYKRVMLDDRRGFYSYKPGADLRSAFRDAVIEAIDFVAMQLEDFRQFTLEERRIERSKYGVHYAQPDQGLVSTRGRIDRAEFIRDVTIPDGSLIPIGAHFTKTWEIRNSGQVPWFGRRLTRMSPQGATLPWSVDFVPIPDTLPGQVVQLSVDFVAARVQGSSTIWFKMTDENGNLYFPNKYAHGLTMLIETSPLVWIDREPVDLS